MDDDDGEFKWPPELTPEQIEVALAFARLRPEDAPEPPRPEPDPEREKRRRFYCFLRDAALRAHEVYGDGIFVDLAHGWAIDAGDPFHLDIVGYFAERSTRVAEALAQAQVKREDGIGWYAEAMGWRRRGSGMGVRGRFWVWWARLQLGMAVWSILRKTPKLEIDAACRRAWAENPDLRPPRGSGKDAKRGLYLLPLGQVERLPEPARSRVIRARDGRWGIPSILVEGQKQRR